MFLNWKNCLLAAAAFVMFAGGCCHRETNDYYIRVEGTTPELKTTIPIDGGTVPLLSPEQKSYVDMTRARRIKYFADKVSRGAMQDAGYYPMSVTLKCVCPSENEHTFTVSESANFENAITFNTERPNVALYNLKIAQKYYWKNCRGDVFEFTTEDKAPRLLKIDGVPNVRDLGGRIGLNGKRVKQGLIYRTAGLNDNARQRYLSESEVLKKPEVKAAVDKCRSIIKKAETDLKNKTAVTVVPNTISKAWTVYRPDKDKITPAAYEMFGKLTAVPEQFFGVEGERMIADQTGAILLPGDIPFRPQFFIQEFTAAKDGVIQAGCGADWAWQIWVNGELILDMMKDGDSTWPPSKNNILVEIPVKKGKNIIAVPLLSGSVKWVWYFGGLDKPVTHAEMLAKRISYEKRIMKSLLRVQDGYYLGKNRLNDDMKQYITQNLGWKSDIDLRSDRECYGMTGSPAGQDVEWFHISSSAYAGIDSEAGKAAFTKVFNVFLDPKNYPIDFHCIAGQDRTGAVAFIINGLLGVPEDQLYLDWEVTGFWNDDPTFNHANRFNKLVAAFSKYPGKTINERIENYVLSLGFARKDIQFLRDFMLE